ncbi:glycosyltransferase [Streptomyces roseicoloratus]|uniref:Glycosyltransferase n=1 Tax=Streptomyces roseicoloratus TaxID=2508722 RepID=A0ABY9RUX0_9ACTN|nr:glycosyltransferase [Streptomyces roseicoloratus]WMX45999.1 glycosyltransferase [Streptomyces roseicoloratus]
MRVVLSSYGSRGDVEPMVALAVALRGLGVDVRVCAPDDAEFAERLAGVGVEFVPVRFSIRALVAQARGAGAPPSMTERVTSVAAAQYEAVTAAGEGADTVVATGLFPAVAGARSAAEKLGLRFAYVSYFPGMLPSPHHPPYPLPGRPLPEGVTDNRTLWDLDLEGQDAVYGPGITAFRQTVGLPPLASVRPYAVTGRPLLAADPVLGPWQEPADLDVVQTGVWTRPDDRPLPSDLEDFLQAGEPPVYVGFGSMSMHGSSDTARVAIESVRAQGHRVLVSRGWADLDLIDDRDDCMTVGEANHQALFPRVAAVVHHGGAGTTTTAARAGVPQVVIPQLVDQPYWASRVAALGIGAAHDGPVPTVESLSAALTTALAPHTVAAAAALAADIRTDGAERTANLLLDGFGEPARTDR